MDIFAAETWAAYDPEGLITLRLEQVLKTIPAGVESILDAGCGNGVITNALHPGLCPGSQSDCLGDRHSLSRPLFRPGDVQRGAGASERRGPRPGPV